MKTHFYAIWLLASLVFQAQAQDELPQMDYDALIELTTEYLNLADYPKALAAAEFGKEKAQKEFGNQDSIYAKMLVKLACVYSDMALYPKAESLFLEAQKLYNKGFEKQELNHTNCLENLGILNIRISNYTQAELLLLEAKKRYAKLSGKGSNRYATCLNDLAYLYYHMGDYDRVMTNLAEATKIVAQIFGKNNTEYSAMANNLATVYADLGKFQDAKTLFLEVQQIEQKLLDENHPSYALTLHNLANVHRHLNEFEQAEPLYLKSIFIHAKTYGEEHPEHACSLNSLAVLYCDMSKLDTAFHYAMSSLAYNAAALQDNNFQLNDLDKIEYYSNEYANLSISTLLTILKKQYQKTGDKQKLQAHYQLAQTAMRLNERIRNNFSNDNDKLRSLAVNGNLLLQGLQSALQLKTANYEQESFRFAELNKAVLLMDAAKTEDAYRFGDLPDDLLAEEMALQEKQSELEVGLLEKKGEAAKDSLQKALLLSQQQIEDFKQKIEQKYTKYAALKYQNKSIEIADIQGLLDDKTALLEYVVGDSLVYVFYIDKKTSLLSEKKLAQGILKTNTQRLHAALSNYSQISNQAEQAYKDYTEIAHWFYQNLLEKELENAANIEHLLIIPDGELGYLPFETFLREKAPATINYTNLAYLVKDFRISYNYSATLWKENLQSKKNLNNGQILGMAGNYTTEKNSTKASTHKHLRDALLPLPAARSEVAALVAQFEGYFAFDSLASEKEFKKKAQEYGIIHLAMHGILDKKTPILSSLAFTEDGDTAENNFLQAYEISKMQLNADLVVLSACETGFGKFEKGNGTASLARAFMYAGVPAMVVSLWEVNDASTSQLMQFFYTNLAAGMDKAEALRQAKIQYLSSAKGIAAHPAYWSAFVQMGDSRPVTLATKQKGYWYGWLAGGVGLLGAIFLVIKLRKG